MSDPQPVPQRRTPRRAAPLQPDKPGSALTPENKPSEGDAAASAHSEASADKQRQQSAEALKNVSTGYD